MKLRHEYPDTIGRADFKKASLTTVELAEFWKVRLERPITVELIHVSKVRLEHLGTVELADV